MKIDNNLRNLLLKQPETLMLARNKCEYIGAIYTFSSVTSDELEVERLKLLKLLDKRGFAQVMWDKLFKKNG